MKEITAERRLELIRLIREENNHNRMKLRTREHILYGKREDSFAQGYTGNYEEAAAETGYFSGNAENGEKENSKVFSGLWVRTLLATVLFAVYVILDFSGGSLFSVNSNDIHNRISKNCTSNVIDFMEEITYTLDDTAIGEDR